MGIIGGQKGLKEGTRTVIVSVFGISDAIWPKRCSVTGDEPGKDGLLSEEDL